MPRHEARTAEALAQSVLTAAGAEFIQRLGFLFSWNAEVTTFYSRRYQQCLAFPYRLAGCATPQDVQKLQGQVLEQLVADYQAEAAKLSRIVGAPEEQSKATAESEYAARLQDAQRDAAAIIEQAKAQAERIVEAAEKRASRPAASRKTQTKTRA